MTTTALGPDISRTNIPYIWGTDSETNVPSTFISSRRSHTPIWPAVDTFAGRLVLNDGERTFPVQEFVITQSKQGFTLQSTSAGLNPTIEFVLSEVTKEISIKPKPAGLNSVESEILYTRFYWTLINSKSIALFSEENESLFRIGVTKDMRSTWESVEYRAKLFRKLHFLEYFFERRFSIPVHVPWQDAMAIEMLFRGITEGEFEFPAGNAFRLPSNTISLDSINEPPFSHPGKWVYKLPFDFETILGVVFPVGSRTITAKRASLANPRLLRDIERGQEPKEISIKVMDYMVSCRFEKYADSKKLLVNRGKLNKFKDLLRRNEPDDLVSLLDSSLASIPSDVAIEMVEGILQFYDFPDRFSVSDPVLDGKNWIIKIGLNYQGHEAIWLDELVINKNTGHLSLNQSFEELLKKGRKMAKETLSVS